MNLRKQAESDLSFMLEDLNGFGLPAILKGPDGEIQTANGQILNSSFEFNPDTGETIISKTPVVTLRISSLSPVPIDGENWYFEIPTTPDPDSVKKGYILDGSKAIVRNDTFGIVKFFLTEAEQTP